MLYYYTHKKLPFLYCSKPSLSTINNRKEGFTMDNNEKKCNVISIDGKKKKSDTYS
nr:DUF3931 domain-containing protein [Streptococcus sp. 11-4097]